MPTFLVSQLMNLLDIGSIYFDLEDQVTMTSIPIHHLDTPKTDLNFRPNTALHLKVHQLTIYFGVESPRLHPVKLLDHCDGHPPGVQVR